MSDKPRRIPTNDRQMTPAIEPDGEVFFFPKHNPPISVRATSRQEAERLLKEQREDDLEANNQQEA